MKIKKHSGSIRTRHIRRAQINEMKKQWPAFIMQQCKDGTILWQGLLRGFQRSYLVRICWNIETYDRPYVFLREPTLIPRPGTTFEDIPHLMYYSEKPQFSGLCLFDPNGGEWSPNQLIANTTLPWAAQWLYFYELWHHDGKWRGGGVGPESIAQARAETVHKQAAEHASNQKKEAPVAVRQAIQDSVS